MSDLDLNFSEIINMIETRRNNADKKVNEELISLYQDFGKYISGQGDGSLVQFFSDCIEKIYKLQ